MALTETSQGRKELSCGDNTISECEFRVRCGSCRAAVKGCGRNGLSHLQSSNDFAVVVMSGPPGIEVTVKVAAEQGEISQAVQYFVSRALVVAADLVVDDSLGAK